MGEHNHPEITMHTFSLLDYVEHIEKGSWENVAEMMLASVDKLAKAGAEFAILSGQHHSPGV